MYVAIGLAAIAIIPVAVGVYKVADWYIATPLKKKLKHHFEQRNRDEVDIEIELQKQDNNERKARKEKLVYLAKLQKEGKLLDEEINREIEKQEKELLDYENWEIKKSIHLKTLKSISENEEKTHQSTRRFTTVLDAR